MALRYLFVYSGDVGEIEDSNGAALSTGVSSLTITLNSVNYVNFEPVDSTKITDGQTYLQGFDGGSTSTYSAGGGIFRVRAVCFPSPNTGNRIAAVALGLEITNIIPPSAIATSFGAGPGALPSTITFGGGWRFVGFNQSNVNDWLRLTVDL